MLYLSTRSRTDSYTAHRALFEERTPDGGLYVPFQLPRFSAEEIRHLKSKSFSENVANILNLFFSSNLSSWDVEFSCGRYPIKQIALPHRLHVIEMWRNATSDFAQIEQALYDKLTATRNSLPRCGWARIAIDIAMLFAVYGEMATADTGLSLDIAVDTDAFTVPIAAWYAKQMGLPIGSVICGTYNHGCVWDLIHLGTISTAVQTNELVGIERLIFLTLGADEALRYAACCQERRPYHLEAAQRDILSQGFFAAVVSKDRLVSLISNFYRSREYILDFVSAISFCALQDYRARTGESKHTLIMSMISPMRNTDIMTGLLGITASELECSVNKQRG